MLAIKQARKLMKKVTGRDYLAPQLQEAENAARQVAEFDAQTGGSAGKTARAKLDKLGVSLVLHYSDDWLKLLNPHLNYSVVRWLRLRTCSLCNLARHSMVVPSHQQRRRGQ